MMALLIILAIVGLLGFWYITTELFGISILLALKKPLSSVLVRLVGIGPTAFGFGGQRSIH